MEFLLERKDSINLGVAHSAKVQVISIAKIGQAGRDDWPTKNRIVACPYQNFE
jgi:hypothetical protein